MDYLFWARRNKNSPHSFARQFDTELKLFLQLLEGNSEQTYFNWTITKHKAIND